MGDKLFAKDTKGNTALHQSENVEIFRAILEAVSNEGPVPASEYIDDSVLMRACQEKKSEIVEHIVTKYPKQAKQIVRRRHQEGKSIIQFASTGPIAAMLMHMFSPEEKIVLMMQKGQDGKSILHTACDQGKVDLVEILLSTAKRLGIIDRFIFLKDNAGCTALFYGCEQWMGTTIVQLLINAL